MRGRFFAFDPPVVNSTICGVRRLFVAAALMLLWMVAPATSRASSPCHEWPFTLPSRSVFHAAHIPVLSPTTVVARYDADVLRPAKVPQGVRLPGVVLLHGRGGAKCALWWAARLLAGRGYETLVLTYPSSGTVAQAEPRGATAARAALAWLRSSANPYRSKLKANDLAVMGHSLGVDRRAGRPARREPALREDDRGPGQPPEVSDW